MKQEKTATVTDLIHILEGLCEQGLGKAKVSFVGNDLDNYYLGTKCKKNIVGDNEIVELHLKYWR